jgi:hypothetical protein
MRLEAFLLVAASDPVAAGSRLADAGASVQDEFGSTCSEQDVLRVIDEGWRAEQFELLLLDLSERESWARYRIRLLAQAYARRVTSFAGAAEFLEEVRMQRASIYEWCTPSGSAVSPTEVLSSALATVLPARLMNEQDVIWVLRPSERAILVGSRYHCAICEAWLTVEREARYIESDDRRLAAVRMFVDGLIQRVIGAESRICKAWWLWLARAWLARPKLDDGSLRELASVVEAAISVEKEQAWEWLLALASMEMERHPAGSYASACYADVVVRAAKSEFGGRVSARIVNRRRSTLPARVKEALLPFEQEQQKVRRPGKTDGVADE